MRSRVAELNIFIINRFARNIVLLFKIYYCSTYLANHFCNIKKSYVHTYVIEIENNIRQLYQSNTFTSASRHFGISYLLCFVGIFFFRCIKKPWIEYCTVYKVLWLLSKKFLYKKNNQILSSNNKLR